MSRKFSVKPHADDTEYAARAEELAKCTRRVRYVCNAMVFGFTLSLRCVGDVRRHQKPSDAVGVSLLQVCSARTSLSTSVKLRVQTEFLGQKGFKRNMKQRSEHFRFTQTQAAFRTTSCVSDICLRCFLSKQGRLLCCAARTGIGSTGA